MGDLQPGPAALLRHVPRGGRQVPQGRKIFGLSGEHAKICVPDNDALLERESSRPAAVQDPLPGVGDHRARADLDSAALPESKVDPVGVWRKDHPAVAEIVRLRKDIRKRFGNKATLIFELTLTPPTYSMVLPWSSL